MNTKLSKYFRKIETYKQLFRTLICKINSLKFNSLSLGLIFKLKFIFVLLLSACLTIMAGAVKVSVLAKMPTTSLMDSSLASEKSTIDLLGEAKKLYDSGQFNDAINLLQQASATFKVSQDILSEAIALTNMSYSWQKLGQWTQAETAITSSLELIGKLQQTPQTLKAEAQALNAQGSLEFNQGQSEKAIEHWQKATQIYTQIGDEIGKNRTLINQAQAMQSMGLYRRAVDTLKEVNQNLQNSSDSQLKVAGLRSLGNTLRLIGNLEESQKVLEESLKQARKLNSTQDINDTLLSLGNTLRSRQDVPAALAYYQQAATSNGTLTTKIRARVNQISLLVETQKNAEAMVLWSQVQPLLSELPPSRIAVEARINLAQSLMKIWAVQNQASSTPENKPQTKISQDKDSPFPNPQVQEIADLLVTAIQQSKGLGDQRSESYALGQLGTLYEHNQQLSYASELTDQALVLAQSLNAAEISYRWQWQRGRIQQQQGNINQAIASYTEAVDLLKSLRSDLVAINSDVQFSFRESVEPIYRQFVGLLLNSNGKKDPTQENLIKARNVIESLQLAELDNFFQEACLQVKSKELDQVDRSAAVIYPIILADRLEVILSIPKQPVRHYSTPLSGVEVENILDKLKQTLTPIGSNQARLKLSAKIYDWLIRPAQADLEAASIKTLVFVLDGSLRNFPMGALYDGKQYLIEKYSVALSPGLQLLDPQPLTRSTFQVLQAGLSEARQGFSALPAVQSELKQISAEVPGKLLLNQAWTKSNIQIQLSEAPFPVIHLATHGQFSSKAKETFILTWDGKINVKDLDQLLRARGGKENPLQLLVLSACQTASGDKRATLGLAGVAVRSGARSTLASLWSVKDDATAALMTSFYRELPKPGVTKAEALRRAQLSLIRDRRFSHPLYWAPFVLVGNWL